MASTSRSCRVSLAFATAACLMAACPNVHGQTIPSRPVEPSVQTAKGTVDLRPRFKLGTDRRIVLKQETSQTLPQLDADGSTKSGGGHEQRVRSTHEITLVFRPVSVSDEGSQVEIAIEAIRASRSGGDAEDSFDSSKPVKAKPAKPGKATPKNDPNDLLDQLMEAQSLENQMRPLIGEKMIMRLGPTGDIIEVRGGEKLVQALAPMGGGLGALTAAASDGATPSSEDLFKSIVSGPGKSTANVGETWESLTDLDLSILGRSSLRTRSTLASMRGPLAQIETRGSLEPSSESNGKDAAGPKVDVSYSGTYQWDTEDGFVHAMNTRQLTTIRLQNSAKPVTITAETNTSITRSGVSVRQRK